MRSTDVSTSETSLNDKKVAFEKSNSLVHAILLVTIYLLLLVVICSSCYFYYTKYRSKQPSDNIYIR